MHVDEAACDVTLRLAHLNRTHIIKSIRVCEYFPTPNVAGRPLSVIKS